MSCTDCHTQNTPNPIRLEVRIGDFGLVTVADPDSNASIPSEAVGTEIYRPPTATARHPSLDIYALGIAAFELLCKFNTRMERLHTVQQLKQGEFPLDFGKAWGMKVGEAMKECIGSMLAQDGDAVSISELKQKLEAIVSMRERTALS
jgi:serine/threonine protein kinase